MANALVRRSIICPNWGFERSLTRTTSTEFARLSQAGSRSSYPLGLEVLPTRSALTFPKQAVQIVPQAVRRKDARSPGCAPTAEVSDSTHRTRHLDAYVRRSVTLRVRHDVERRPSSLDMTACPGRRKQILRRIPLARQSGLAIRCPPRGATASTPGI